MLKKDAHAPKMGTSNKNTIKIRVLVTYTKKKNQLNKRISLPRTDFFWK